MSAESYPHAVGMRASQFIWATAGRPVIPGGVSLDGRCYWCGLDLTEESFPTKKVCGPSFTNHDSASVPTSKRVCMACVWVMAGKPPNTLRQWSVLVSPGRVLPPSNVKASHLVQSAHIHLHSKADPSAFVAALSDPPEGPWVVSIADSGQIHVAPFAVVNDGTGPWCVRFEREDVRAHPSAFRELHHAVVACMDAGISKASILEGDMTVAQWRRLECREAWDANEPTLSRHRGGALMRLVLFLARRTNPGEKR